MRYIKVIFSNKIIDNNRELHVLFYGSNLILTVDYTTDNFYIVKKQLKKLFKEQNYINIANIEILKLYINYNYLNEIEELFHELKNAYREKIENEIQNKTIEVETLKLVYPIFN